MISVIVPVYNVEQYLPKCIESLVSQTYTNLQIILINDGSTDNSGTICDSYAKRDDRIIVIHQKNQGVSIARNQGLAVATGEYVGFVDPDDWCELNMYAEMLKVMQQNDVDLVICYQNVYDKNCKSAQIMLSVQTFSKLTVVHKPLHYGKWNKLFKKSITSKLNFKKRLCYGEDALFVSRCIYKIERIALLNIFFYNVYQIENSSSRGWLTSQEIVEFFEICVEDTYVKGVERYPELKNHFIISLNVKGGSGNYGI